MSENDRSRNFIIGAAGGALAAAAYMLLIRPRMLTWGATQYEVDHLLPGDELIPMPKICATHAVTIQTPQSAVWPWLAQLGQGRGGFYTYDWIENMMGLDIHTADRILPEHQDIKAGDTIALAPEGFSVPIAIVDPGHTLVLHGDTRNPEAGEAPPMRPGDYLAMTWGFYLLERGDSATRLIERFKMDWNPSLANSVLYQLFLEPGAFLMERRMLLGIKERAEALHDRS
jgi:hypothetical protein